MTSSKRVIAMACGTGATVSGIINGLAEREESNTKVVGISVLKAPGYIGQQVEQYLTVEDHTVENIDWRIDDRFHGGGYARSNSDLDFFLASWQRESSIQIEPVYTGKLFWGLKNLAESGEIEHGSEVIAIHSGGII